MDSSVLMLIGGVWDIVDARSSADRYNRGLDIQVAPTALRAADGTIPGLAVSGRF